MSAYDIHHGYVPKSAVNEANLVFLDSGGYETVQPPEILEASSRGHKPREWSESDHLALLAELEVVVDLVATTPDKYTSVLEQVERARTFREEFPHFGTSLLIKPRSPGAFLDTEEVIGAFHSLPQVDVLGFVDKDLEPIRKPESIGL